VSESERSIIRMFVNIPTHTEGESEECLYEHGNFSSLRNETRANRTALITELRQASLRLK